MAMYYAGPRFWNLKEMQDVTVSAPGTVNRKQWVNSMTAWAQDHGIEMQWQGESTHHEDDQHWHQAHFLIPREENRTLFLLRWGSQ